MTARVCNAVNTLAVDESSFFSSSKTVNWDYHRIGWVVAGSMAILTLVISSFSIFMHCRSYHAPLQQRQIIRILLMPPVYAIISFFSYRFFRAYTYYSLIETVYEAFAICAFMFLLVQYIGHSPPLQRQILAEQPKRSIPFPFCCWRYRPSKPYFLHTTKWLVLQYCIFRPLITIVAIICEAHHVLCPQQYSVFFAQAYLEAFDFVVFSIALYGLIVFYTVTKDHLKGRSPLAKFLTIKGIVFFTFYQGFVFSILEKHGVIRGSQYWTATNVSEGLQALCTTVEMVAFSIIMIFSFSWKPYTQMNPTKRTGVFRSLLHSQNYSDFCIELYSSMKFFWDYAQRKPYTTSKAQGLGSDADSVNHRRPLTGLDFNQAYDFEPSNESPPQQGYKMDKVNEAEPKTSQV
ncbi:uncharacterized protein MELLADRAFT_41419 [Melampsora larici-populina 98AG31]|uniref:Uncharacterized protein n=1 Tax=Melampsora larici-populina (strain 98AG31 / pathotype 3-4-7) TaxID=747676 RepID=F4R3F8_MELLP|nr:uncharacterized protein MELLADRAFT_41419 [Melampsora larici-populina 98AG31]EGG12620.1 hypothetical protein MELLADRAFT_41419 [Melampsora larici-populina 98AG31]